MPRTSPDPVQSLFDADRREALEYILLAVLLAGLALVAFVMSLYANLSDVGIYIGAALITMFACLHRAARARAHSRLSAPQRKHIEDERVARLEQRTGEDASLKPSWAKRMQNP
jgi:hypothetical protein